MNIMGPVLLRSFSGNATFFANNFAPPYGVVEHKVIHTISPDESTHSIASECRVVSTPASIAIRKKRRSQASFSDVNFFKMTPLHSNLPCME